MSGVRNHPALPGTGRVQVITYVITYMVAGACGCQLVRFAQLRVLQGSSRNPAALVLNVDCHLPCSGERPGHRQWQGRLGPPIFAASAQRAAQTLCRPFASVPCHSFVVCLLPTLLNHDRSLQPAALPMLHAHCLNCSTAAQAKQLTIPARSQAHGLARSKVSSFQSLVIIAIYIHYNIPETDAQWT